MTPTPIGWVSLQKEIRTERETQGCMGPEGQEEVARSWSWEKPNLPGPWSRASTLQNCEKIYFWCLSTLSVIHLMH